MYEIGDNFKHRHISDLTCEIMDHTRKGYKVRQREGRRKAVIKFYEAIWFNPETGVWIKDH